VYEDVEPLARLLANLHAIGDRLEGQLEVVVVDGGSRDNPESVCPASVRFINTGVANRGYQLAEGAAASSADWIWLLHADSEVPASALEYLLTLTVSGWGRFDVRLETRLAAGTRPTLAIVGWFMNARSNLTSICTGDQGIFVHRSLLERIGGVPRQPLMEDIELSARLRQLCQPLCPPLSIGSSARRWEARGVLRTIVFMWWFRVRYWLGVNPAELAREYYAR
jgi:rSAM/selenodomain-associated transferase 2